MRKISPAAAKYESGKRARAIPGVNGTLVKSHVTKACLHCQSFCGGFVIKKCPKKLTRKCLALNQFPQTFLTNPLKRRIDQSKVPTVVTETLMIV